MLTFSSFVRLSAVASLLALGLVGACGGEQQGVIADGGSGEGSGGLGGAGGSGGTGGGCVDVVLSSFDRSCNVASDCATITTGDLCNGDCQCGDAAINQSGLARYESAVSSVTRGLCKCFDRGTPQCVRGTCTLCGPGSTDPGCGNSTGDGGIGFSDGGFGEATTNEGSIGSETSTFEVGPPPPVDAGMCVDIVVSTYDTSCKVTSDCIGITAGKLCPGSCECGGATINKDGDARYNAAISGIKFALCPCSADGTPTCVMGSCVLCGFGSKTPGCPDGG